MNSFDDKVLDEIKNFNLPNFSEIPNVGLFLEQVTKYIGEYLNPLDESVTLTGSMISNYVKKDIIKNPVKKQYAREEIAYLFFIAIAKSVLSLEDITVLLNIQKEKCQVEEAYDIFKSEFKNTLNEVFGIKQKFPTPTLKSSTETILLSKTIITVCHKIYLDKYLKSLKSQ